MLSRGYVLGPLLIVTFINGLDEEVEGWMTPFADDTKVGDVVVSRGFSKVTMGQDAALD